MRLWAVLIMVVTFIGAAYARDLGQWENSDPQIKEWYRNLMRPDAAGSSCCGEADAYWCDNIKVIDDPSKPKKTSVTCAITDDRDDKRLGRPHVDIGTVIVIPDDKMKWGPTDPQPRIAANPTGHNIVFLSANSNWGGTVIPAVLCFVPGTGI